MVLKSNFLPFPTGKFDFFNFTVLLLKAMFRIRVDVVRVFQICKSYQKIKATIYEYDDLLSLRMIIFEGLAVMMCATIHIKMYMTHAHL